MAFLKLKTIWRYEPDNSGSCHETLKTPMAAHLVYLCSVQHVLSTETPHGLFTVTPHSLSTESLWPDSKNLHIRNLKVVSWIPYQSSPNTPQHTPTARSSYLEYPFTTSTICQLYWPRFRKSCTNQNHHQSHWFKNALMLPRLQFFHTMDPQRVIRLQKLYQNSQQPLWLRGPRSKALVYPFYALFAYTTGVTVYYLGRGIAGIKDEE